MKIIQLIPNFNLAGAEIMCENLIYELIMDNHDVLAVSLYSIDTPITQRLTEKNVKIVFLDKKAGFDFSVIKKLRAIILDFKPDVIHTHLYALKYAVMATRNLNIKIVHTVHNIASKETSRFQQKVNKIYYARKKAYPVALSPLIKESFVELYGEKYNDMPVIFNGINLSNCVPKRTYKISEGYKILHVGRFNEQKNHQELFKAILQLKQKNQNVELYCVGDGELRPQLEKFIADNKLQDTIHLEGLQSDVYRYLTDADIFVLPSVFEGIPMTIIEAMGSGLPIVASNVGGIPNMLVDNESALLCKPQCSSVCECIEKMIDDTGLRERLGLKALERSVLFSSQEMAKKYIEVYWEGFNE